MIEVELKGLEIFGHHGVEEHERREGQTFLFDISFFVADEVEDRIEDAVDYREVAATVRELSEGHTFNLLEALAAAAAEAILERYPVEAVRVRVRKPKMGLPVEHTAATAWRGR
ncbi:MAG TPA: dihydroneopterin aldolase [Gaiellaceae bacterium]